MHDFAVFLCLRFSWKGGGGGGGGGSVVPAISHHCSLVDVLRASSPFPSFVGNDTEKIARPIKQDSEDSFSPF